MDHFVHYREVVLFQRQKCIATIYNVHVHVGWFIGKCPLFRVSFIEVSTVPKGYSTEINNGARQANELKAGAVQRSLF